MNACNTLEVHRLSHCIECNATGVVALDPRDPPLAVNECLCRDCALSAYDDLIEERETELTALKNTRELLEREN